MYKNLSYLKTNLKTELSHFCQPNPNSFFIKFICLRVFFLVQGCMVEKKSTIYGVYMTGMLRRVYTTEKLVRTSQKQWYRPVSFVKKYWSFRKAIGAYKAL